MSVAYQAVQWNRQKRLYDLALAGGCVLFLGAFFVASAVAAPGATAETLLIRAFGALALILLHVVLSIGPLARLDRRVAPLLYNRRHLGVTMFLAGLVHAVVATIQFHSFGTLHPLANILAGATPAGGLAAPFAQIPFQPFGLLALLILFVMASTSHDFWLANLTAPTWKALHMLVYVAYGALLVHVALGVLQTERHPLYLGLLAAGAVWIFGVHLAAGLRERAIDRTTRTAASDVEEALEARLEDDGFVEVCRAEQIPDRRALTVTLAGDRVAIFRDCDAVHALSSVCKHQNGPLGEGKIVDGCVVCPWHGYQYLPATGASPPPFTETVPTFRVAAVGDRIFVHPTPRPAGSVPETVEVTRVALPSDGEPVENDPFYIGWEPRAAAPAGRWARGATIALLLAAVGLGSSLAALQAPFAQSFFEFGAPRVFEGIVRLEPHPRLLVESPDGTADGWPFATWLLVGEFKHGAEAQIDPALDGRRIRLEGTPIYRGERSMLEVVGGSVGPADQDGPGVVDPSPEAFGARTLRGEIVDSKCHLGVMKPGEGKTHRACATLCIRGGIPPLFLVDGSWTSDDDGAAPLPDDARRLLLVGPSGEPINEQILPWVAETIELRGDVIRLGDLWILEASPVDFRRSPDANGVS